ncbi:uncharacterized protein M421DRAFT_2288 [Didymella exigua CBS 183.55]|uniref:Integral membrane protein n=1 Tax=Didymella exigua CBS 183.55 TaxID=1150837 RepID=A0A6A5RTB0_9PLEO|nr:uncharacterized protein M421DRAFT_2288 [Didymella exigua CBS 183.55]KAF1931641.1 hypothetical protein M421DRAFT_2288 [Didymella exigua CBS 183.55]
MARGYVSSSSRSRCFDSYWRYRPEAIADYAHAVVFLAVFLGILVTLCVVRKRAGAGKRLIGLAYIGALSLVAIQYAFQFIMRTLSACEVLNDNRSAFNTSIAGLVLSWISTMLLLYVVFYLLNMMLRKQLGQNLSVLRVVFGIDLFILGVLLFTYTVMLCQYYYELGRNDYFNPGVNIAAAIYISLAFDALHVLSIIGSGALSVLAVKSLRQRSMAQSSLLAWVALLHFSLLVSAVWSLTATAIQVGGGLYYGEIAYTVMSWISSTFYALAFVIIIVIARNPVWGSTADTVQQQYAYHQEDPVFDGAQRA